jgi:ParB family chromosome partitioning protein
MEALADDDENDKVYLTLDSEAEALQERRKEIGAALSVWPAEWMAQAGCVVHVGPNGAATVKYGLIRPEDRSEVAQVARQAEERGASNPVATLPSRSTRPVHSEKLLRRLTAHRVAAVQAELLDRPDVAVAALAAHLAQKVLRDALQGAYRSANVLAITATDNGRELRSAAEDVEASPAGVRLQAERSAWIERLPNEPDAVFRWLLTQEQATVLQLLTFLVAVTVNGIYGTEPERQSNEPLAQALGLDMSRRWKATGESYFNHVSKARVLDVVVEAVDAPAAGPLAMLKKDAVVAGAERALSGSRWLPACLRTQSASGAQAEVAQGSAGTDAEASALEA